MELRLTMNLKELKRVKTLEQIEQKKLSVEQGSESLGISNRQIYRLLKRYRKNGLHPG
jgi:molybdenum-dependent DNA-binding transcriptional regulator ModE